ncbi:peroxiredoxin-like family protein [Pseudonocardia sp. KRD291]|uniref:peroxiredoxin-like family protein n=1 Tax=Pseudonocardia sp. KRD291 TaxID=2792007 RepID=UPI001C4A0EA5|nr:peroxiredoxin-like family protein [Pseudonocardia sp. KRD291]MBW0101189.1 AhpC/TSA family protein [Pseudonocardia sp. KRD291]
MTTAHETIADRIETMARSGPASRLPADAAAAFATEQAGLRAGGVPAGVRRPGSPMPDAELLDTDGRATSLSAAAAGRPAVVVFYRGAWCPYCNLTLRTYQEQLVGELDRRGIALLAVSPQRPDGSLTTAQADELTYTVLSDPGNQVATALGVVTVPSAEVRDAQRGLGLDLTEVNADGTAALPMPTVVLLDPDGTIRWIDVHPDYTSRTEPADVLHAVET